MNRIKHLLTAIVVIVGLFALGDAAIAAAKAKHHNGKDLLGEKIKTNGSHVLDKKGNYTASVEVKDGKIAGVHVKHAKKGDVPVKKYKTNKKMAQAGGHIMYASFLPGQEYVGI